MTLNEPAAAPVVSTKSSVELTNVTQLVPEFRWWAYALALVMGCAAGALPWIIEPPAALTWLRTPSAAPLTILFGVGMTLAVIRLIQFIAFKRQSDDWGPLANDHACARGAVEADTLAPETLRSGALRDCRFSLKSAVAFSAWPIYVICILMLLWSIPLMALTLRDLGRQTDLLSVLWIPTVAIVLASLVWIILICSSAIGSIAVERWYAGASEEIGNRFTKTLAGAHHHSAAAVEASPEIEDVDEFDHFDRGKRRFEVQPETPHGMDFSEHEATERAAELDDEFPPHTYIPEPPAPLRRPVIENNGGHDVDLSGVDAEDDDFDPFQRR